MGMGVWGVWEVWEVWGMELMLMLAIHHPPFTIHHSQKHYSSTFQRLIGMQSISSLSKALAMTKSTRSSID